MEKDEASGNDKHAEKNNAFNVLTYKT